MSPSEGHSSLPVHSPSPFELALDTRVVLDDDSDEEQFAFDDMIREASERRNRKVSWLTSCCAGDESYYRVR